MTAVKDRSPHAIQFADDASRWRAVRERDPAADDEFYYSVRTTGIYCRPSCPARLAKRDNVRFHSTRADAESAGFRPCRRCRPDEPPIAERQRDAVARACRLIETADSPPQSERAGPRSEDEPPSLSPGVQNGDGRDSEGLCRGQASPAGARSNSSNGKSVTEAIYGAGFNSNGRFYESAARELGMTPSTFRNGGAGMTIRFAVGKSSLGQVLVAATEKGICAIFLGDDPE